MRVISLLQANQSRWPLFRQIALAASAVLRLLHNVSQSIRSNHSSVGSKSEPMVLALPTGNLCRFRSKRFGCLVSASNGFHCTGCVGGPSIALQCFTVNLLQSHQCRKRLRADSVGFANGGSLQLLTHVFSLRCLRLQWLP